MKSVENLQLGNEGHLTISYGVAHTIDNGDLISLADQNMYKSKIGGRNRVTN